MFFTRCAYHSTSITADERTIYTVTRSGNTLTSKKNPNALLIRCDVLINRYRFLKERLSADDFKLIHLNWYALARIVDAIMSGYGIRTTTEIYKKFKSVEMQILDKEMFYPGNMFRNIKTEILWHIGIHRTN